MVDLCCRNLESPAFSLCSCEANRIPSLISKKGAIFSLQRLLKVEEPILEFWFFDSSFKKNYSICSVGSKRRNCVK